MDKLTVAQINAAVGSSRLVGAEKYQVTCLQPAGWHAAPQLELQIRRPGQIHAVPGKNVLQIAGAVKGLGGITAKLVGNADVLPRRPDDIGHVVPEQERLALGHVHGRALHSLPAVPIICAACPGSLFFQAAIQLKVPPCHLQGIVGFFIHNPRNLNLVGTLKSHHRPVGAIAEDPVQLRDAVPQCLEAFLHLHHLRPPGIFLQICKCQCRIHSQQKPCTPQHSR